MKLCPYCKNEVHEKADKCMYCHEWLSDDFVTTDDKILDELAEIKKKLNAFWWALIVVPGILFVLYVIITIASKKP